MTTRSVDNYSTIENYNDVVDVLVAENAINNIPNGSSNGQIPVWYSGTYSLTGNTSIRVGQNAGFTNFKDHSIAIGTNAGRHENGTASIAIGFNAGRTHSGTNAVAIGYLAGNITQGVSAISIGDGAGKNQQADWCVALGIASGSTGQLNNSIAIGAASGNFNQGTNSVAIGLYAGYTAQGENSIAIGNQAGMTSQPTGSIVLNSSGNPLSGITQNSFYCDPVRNITTGSNVMCYDITNKEINYASNISLANPLTVTQGSATLPSINFQGDTNCGIFSATADQLDFSTGGTSRMNLNNSRLFITSGQLIVPTGVASTPSISWTGTSINTGIYLPSQDVIGITCDGNLRCSFGTSAITMATSLYLPTSGGTSSALEFYEELTHTTSYDYGNQTNIESRNINCRRIGKMITLSWNSDWGSSYTNTNGVSEKVLTRTALPTRFRPNVNLNAVGIVNVGGTTAFVRIGILSTGIIEFSQASGGGFASGTSILINTNLISYAFV